MDEWMSAGVYRMEALLGRDAEYRELLEQQAEAQRRYERVCEKLSPEDREILEDYIGICEDIEYFKAHIAYRCGKLAR